VEEGRGAVARGAFSLLLRGKQADAEVSGHVGVGQAEGTGRGDDVKYATTNIGAVLETDRSLLETFHLVT
jgi:hypothetical protein